MNFYLFLLLKCPPLLFNRQATKKLGLYLWPKCILPKQNDQDWLDIRCNYSCYLMALYGAKCLHRF